MRSTLFHVLLTLTLLASARVASAQEFKAGDIVVSHPMVAGDADWSKSRSRLFRHREPRENAHRLLGESVEAAARFEIHDTVVEDGVMRMRELKSLELPPGGSIEAKPGGRHVMFGGLLHPLAAGGKIQGVLQFEHAGRVEVEFDIIGMGAPPPGGRGD